MQSQCPFWKVYQTRRENRIYATTYGECERFSQGTQAIFRVKIGDHVDSQWHLLRSCSTSASAVGEVEVGGRLTGVDKGGRGDTQARLLVQVGEVNHAHAAAVAQWDDVTIAPLHDGGQIVKMIFDVVRLIVRNCTRVDLNQKKITVRQMPTACNPRWQQNGNLLLDVLKCLSETGLQRVQEVLPHRR